MFGQASKPDSHHCNLFTKKFANCKGKSKKAVKNRANLERAKLLYLKNKAITLEAMKMMNQAIKELAKRKGIDSITTDDVKQIQMDIKNEISTESN